MTGKVCAPCEYPWRGATFYTSGIRVRGSWLRNSEAQYLLAKRRRRRIAKLYAQVLKGRPFFASSSDSLIVAFATPAHMRAEVEKLNKGEL